MMSYDSRIVHEPQLGEVRVLPKAVNFHFIPHCNYECKFCFATFNDIPSRSRLSKEDTLKIPALLANAGAEKITLVGGEPTLCPWLNELLEKSKKAGLTTCVVTNGTGMTSDWLEENHHLLDWVGISIDASNDIIHAKIGRGLRKDLVKGVSKHLELTRRVWKDCKKHGIKMKLNTVICSENIEDDMSVLVAELKPDRWKIFQVLPVEGQNSGCVDNLLLSKEEFDSWIKRHEWYKEKYGKDAFVAESNDLMRGSYAMVDALGRFYSNSKGGHVYSDSILDVGVEKSWKKNCFNEERFNHRGGIYDWGGDSNIVNLPQINIQATIFESQTSISRSF